MAAKIFISPSKYVQGAGELRHLGTYVQSLGKKALVLISPGGQKRFGKTIQESFSAAACDMLFEPFQGECCTEEINRLIAQMTQHGCDIVIGVGGGKIFDLAKALAYYTAASVCICPTVASTDAPCSAISVLYTKDGVFDKYLYLPSNPQLVLMDTEVLCKSPVRQTIAGMGDALSTYYEARACQRSGARNSAGGLATQAAMALATLCRDTLFQEGRKAKIALEQKVCTPAVEKILEVNTLLSGLGFESVGLAAAHAVNDALSILEECRPAPHGAKVAFGTIVQLVLEDAPQEELEQVISFCLSVGLPVTMQQLGVEQLTEEKVSAVAERACDGKEPMKNMPMVVTPAMVAAAIWTADAYGQYFLEKQR